MEVDLGKISIFCWKKFLNLLQKLYVIGRLLHSDLAIFGVCHQLRQFIKESAVFCGDVLLDMIHVNSRIL